ncbi:hypothetical protein B0I37DRAFT_422754 [Chaetomium sp. MPI-CAGE-AT-0009]|nr:hypothetical protein B0I37DRAFT_422754 [Chaetomium sp. MPI-CAGE-AT-0009]
MLSSSAWPTASITRSSYSSTCELDASKLTVDCSFPELLARDLTTSENIFMSKAMTAGCPFAGLAAPDSVASASFQRPLLSYRAGHQQQPPSMGTSLLHSFVEEEAGFYAEDLDGDRRLGIENRYLDSSNVPSTGMVPHLTITRKQSVATAATSDSGRCSSLFSHNTHSPTFAILSSCSSHRESSSHGTWYEDDPGSPQYGPASSVFTARSSISDAYQPALDHGNYGDMIEPSKPTADRTGPAQATAEVHFPGSCRGTHARRHTPTNQPRLEKPRIVDISPVSTGLKRISSLKWDRYRAEPPSAASQSRAVAVPAKVIEEHRQGEGIPNEDIRFSVPILETANGRTVIDASAPPPIAFASRDQARHRLTARSSSSMTVDENEILHDGEGPSARAYEKALRGKPSLPDLRRWVEANAETLASPERSTPYTPNAHGIPLPPEVVESLRVSISCFPETMLLTSSLSIETIRAYSRKVKHRPDLDDYHPRSPDSDPIYSRASHSPRPPKRWNMSWLSQARRGSNHIQPPHASSLPGNTQLPSPGMSNLSLATPTPPTPAWAPIKNIFPSATDHLCDTLYAHLLAYNYLTCLVPPIPATPTAASTHDTTTARSDLSIPHKAASLLGMNDTVSAATAYRSPPPSRRSVLSHGRRAGGYTLNEPFAPTAAAASAGGYGLVRSTTGGSSSGLSRGGTSHGFRAGGGAVGAWQEGGAGGPTAAVGPETLLVGLGRCVNMLVATMRREGEGRVAGGGTILGDQEMGGFVEGVPEFDEYLRD